MKAKLVHRAIRGPRDGHIGEQVYSELWRNLMAIPVPPSHWEEHPLTKLHEVLPQYPWKLDQRCASVCATFITWLGCSNGQSIIFRARRLKEEGRQQAFLLAWYENNKRHRWVNHGFRTIEFMLAPDDHFGQAPMERFDTLRWIPYLRQEDHEAIEHLCIWLGDPEGQRFVALAEEEIRRRKAEAFDAQRILGRKSSGVEADPRCHARERIKQG